LKANDDEEDEFVIIKKLLSVNIRNDFFLGRFTVSLLISIKLSVSSATGDTFCSRPDSLPVGLMSKTVSVRNFIAHPTTLLTR